MTIDSVIGNLQAKVGNAIHSESLVAEGEAKVAHAEAVKAHKAGGIVGNINPNAPGNVHPNTLHSNQTSNIPGTTHYGAGGAPAATLANRNPGGNNMVNPTNQYAANQYAGGGKESLGQTLHQPGMVASGHAQRNQAEYNRDLNQNSSVLPGQGMGIHGMGTQPVQPLAQGQVPYPGQAPLANQPYHQGLGGATNTLGHHQGADVGAAINTHNTAYNNANTGAYAPGNPAVGSGDATMGNPMMQTDPAYRTNVVDRQRPIV